MELSTEALLRSDPKDRIEMLARGVQSALYSPNEARNLEGLDSVPYGDEPRVQAQVVGLSAAGAIPSAPASTSAPAAPSAPKKDYHAAVQRDLEALTARAKRAEPLTSRNSTESGNGAAEPGVIRKPKRTRYGGRRFDLQSVRHGDARMRADGGPLLPAGAAAARECVFKALQGVVLGSVRHRK